MGSRARHDAWDENEDDEKLLQVSQQDIIYEDQLCTMLILIDMTACTKLKEVRSNNSSLKKTNACLSHEVMGPLRIITQLCEHMLKQASYKAKFVQAIYQGAKFIELNLVNILEFSRV